MGNLLAFPEVRQRVERPLLGLLETELILAVRQERFFRSVLFTDELPKDDVELWLILINHRVVELSLQVEEMKRHV